MFRAFSRRAARANDDNTCLITALNRAQGLIWFDLDGKILDANDTLGTAPIAPSGKTSARASIRRVNSSASIKAAARAGCRPVTIRSMTPLARPTKS
jgi:hypothetical protein